MPVFTTKVAPNFPLGYPNAKGIGFFGKINLFSVCHKLSGAFL